MNSTMTTLAPELRALANRQGGLFTTAQAAQAGHSDAEVSAAVRAGVWTKMRRGVLIETGRLEQLDDRTKHMLQLQAVRLNSTGPIFASHLTASVLHGLPLLGPTPSLLSVTHPGRAATRVRAGVKHYTGRVRDDETVVIERLPCLTLARTVGDVARTETFDQAVVIADAAMNRGMPREALASVAESCAHWPGVRQLARVVNFACGQSESPGESISRIRLIEQGLPTPLLQVDVRDLDGLIGRVDFLWKQFMTIAEFDGRLKYTDPNALYAEKRREDRLREAGFEVVRFGWAEIQGHPEIVAARVRSAFARYLNRGRAR